MKRSRTARLVCAAAITLIAALGSARPSIAADPPDFSLDFPAGLVCGFDLRVEGRGGPQVFKDFKDKDGNVVRTLIAGTGSALTFTNLSNDKTLSLQANGAVQHITYNADGSSTWKMTGHNILFLFPTDVPAGPSTTLYVGQVVFTVDTSGNFTVQKESGNKTDICAALSG